MALYDTLTDVELTALMRDDNHAAFEQLHGRYFQSLFRAAWNVLKDREACMDVVQEVFVWFWEHREQHEVRSIKAYLLMAVKYQVANSIRSGKVRENFFDRAAAQKLKYSLNAENTELQELKAFIKSITDQLPDRCREVYQLSREEHLTNREIALKMDISEKTVEAQLTKALKTLRTQLGNFNSVFF
jgi:RNA polymerase sigma-70 factor (ECF subfamily)